MKKKILFIIPEYSHGGTNKSLENLLHFLDKEKYEINIYCLYEDGEEYYKKKFEPYIIKKSRIYYLLHDNVVTRKIIGAYNRISGRDIMVWVNKREVKLLQDNNNYDYVVAFQEGSATMFTSLFSTNINKIAWIHWFYGTSIINNYDVDNDFITYSNFEKIVCVSDKAADAFVDKIPKLRKRVDSIYNLLDTKYIISQSYIPINDRCFVRKKFTIVSIGRIAWGKQLHLIPKILSETLKKTTQKDIVWYIIGEGLNAKKALDDNLKKYGMENHVKHIGERNNPYNYIAQSDLLVCPSASESFSYVINEAKILHIPVLSNDFPVAKEMIDERCGFICPIEEMGTLLAKIIDNKDGIYTKVIEDIKVFEYDNSSIVKKIENLFNVNVH